MHRFLRVPGGEVLYFSAQDKKLLLSFEFSKTVKETYAQVCEAKRKYVIV